MKVFNTFYKIVWKNRYALIIYVAIAIVICLLSTGNSSNKAIDSFQSSRVDMAVIDRDHSQSSDAFREYIKEFQNVIDLKDDKEVFQDELYIRNVVYILIIPEHFEENLIAGKEVSLESIEVPNSLYGIYLDMQFNQILNVLKNYLSSGIEPDVAMNQTKLIMQNEAAVTLKRPESASNSVPDYYVYFQVLPYTTIAIIISLLTVVFLRFNDEDIKKRTLCSALSLKQRNLQLALGSTILAAGVYVLLLIVPIALFGTDYFKDPVLGYILLNVFVNVVVCTSLGFLIGTIATKDEQVSIYSTSLSLGLCFLGGVFVPLEIIPEKVQYISRFLPSYWYVYVNNILSKNNIISGKNLNDVVFGISIQLIFAVAIAGFTLVLTKKKAQHV